MHPIVRSSLFLRDLEFDEEHYRGNSRFSQICALISGEYCEYCELGCKNLTSYILPSD